MDRAKLIEKAREGMQHSYAPYSKFHVGAALLGASGKIYTGCNIENGSYGATNCAERTALFKAVSEGEREFEAIAIISDSIEYTSPCGICRQALSEFCKNDFKIMMCNVNGDFKEVTLEELLPEAFSL